MRRNSRLKRSTIAACSIAAARETRGSEMKMPLEDGTFKQRSGCTRGTGISLRLRWSRSHYTAYSIYADCWSMLADSVVVIEAERVRSALPVACQECVVANGGLRLPHFTQPSRRQWTSTKVLDKASTFVLR